jgi:hypothetical protein
MSHKGISHVILEALNETAQVTATILQSPFANQQPNKLSHHNITTELSLCTGILGIAVQWRNLSPFGYSFSEETLKRRFCSESSRVSVSALPE